MGKIARILIGVVVVLGLVGGGALVYLRTSLQPIDGTLSLTGLDQPVEVIRDRHAVPHILAKSEADAYFALGVVHVQDRLWQMEFQRHVVHGRLSEVLGDATLDTDKFLRTLGVARHAAKVYANMPVAARGLLDAYVAGVNAALATWSGPLPPEFLILGVTPEPWTPVDSLGWMTMMAWDLGSNWRSELMRARLLRILTPEQVQDLYPAYPGDRDIPLPVKAAFDAAMPALNRLAAPPFATPALRSQMGSNNWVVDGTRTSTGRPLLANDPHLGLGAPGLWYLARLNAPSLNVIGVTLPGVPSIILGRNDFVAWGFTNTGPDVQDLYIERIDPDDATRYVTPTGTAAFEVFEETIAVNGADPVRLTVRETRHGPVISDVHADAAAWVEEGHAVSLRWTALDPDVTTLAAGLSLPRARDVFEVDAVLRGFHVPQQSVLFADTAGNIGWRAPARVPIRHPDNDTFGLVPGLGWDARYDWQGYIPYEELPGGVNPASGSLFTANQKVVAADYPHFLTSEWAEPYRADRIAELLNARPTHSVESFRRMQMDIRSGWVREFLPFLLRTEAQSEAGRAALDHLVGWDGTMDAEAAQPLIYMAWWRAFVRRLVADDLDALFDDYWSYHVGFVRRAIEVRPQWCDDVGTPTVETCLEQSAAALEDAIADVTPLQGGQPQEWVWGEAHQARHDHAVFSNVPALAWLFELRQPADGGPFTVMQARNRIRNADSPFTYEHGPGWRAIFDLSDLDASVGIFPIGQSGNPFSGHYRDFADLWLRGEFIPLTTRVGEVTTGALGTLILEPTR